MILLDVQLDDGPLLHLGMADGPLPAGYHPAEFQWEKYPPDDEAALLISDLGDWLGCDERKAVLTLTSRGRVTYYGRGVVRNIRLTECITYEFPEVTIQ